jgi:hypothetical protein
MSCSKEDLAVVKTDDFCSHVFCPALEAAWPLGLDRLCRPLVTQGRSGNPFGKIRDPAKIDPSVVDFCNANKSLILKAQDESCNFSEIYDYMKNYCGGQCSGLKWGCLVPQSYCSKIGAGDDSISSTLKVLGDQGSLIDTSGIERYSDESECNDMCLSSKTAGLPALT